MRITRKLKRRSWFVSLAAAAIVLLLRLFGTTWRVRSEGRDPFASGKPFVAALWHRGLLPAAYLFGPHHPVVPVSRSRDGDLTATVLERLGFAASARGSSSRGATSLLRQLIRSVRQGQTVGMLPDGPRGPARQVKPGVLAVARATGAPIQPIAISARPCVRFRSWDRAMLPLPFAQVLVDYGELLEVPKSSDGEELESLRERLEDELERRTDLLDGRLGVRPDRLLEPREA